MGILSSLLGIGQSAPTPVAPQTIQTTELSKEIAPFMKDLLAKGQALYKTRIDEGFQPYTGQTLAKLTPQQLEAREGLTGLVGTQAPQFARAQELTEGVAQQMTPELTQEYMSPYQQAVIDLDKAEAQKTFERDVLPKVRQAQIGAGAFGGTRGTMLEAQTLADQQRLVGDIQTRGSQSAYQDAVRAFGAQKIREGQAGQALAQIAPVAFKAQTGELGLLEQIGKEDQQRSQIALDEAYKQYLEERVYPEQTLGQYQSVISGFPSASVTRTTTTAPQPQQSGLGSLLSGALSAANIYGTFGGFTPGGFGSAYSPARAEGGLVINRQYGGEVGTGGLVGLTDEGTQIFDNSQEGALNRAIHGGIFEAYSTPSTGGAATATPATTASTPATTASTPVATGLDSSYQQAGYTLPKSAIADTDLYNLPSVQAKGGIYNAGDVRDSGMSLIRPADAPETIVQARNQTPYRDPYTGKIPYDLWAAPPVNDFGQGYDLKNMDYFTANALALKEGATRFKYNDEYARVDPGLLSDYDYSNLGTKPYSYMEDSPYNQPNVAMDAIHMNMPQDEYSPSAMRAKGYYPGGIMGQAWTTDPPPGSSARYPTQPNLGPSRMQGIYGTWTRAGGGQVIGRAEGGQVINRAEGGLAGLPTMYRAVGTEGAGRFTLPEVQSGLPPGITYEMLSKMPIKEQQAMLTGNLYNLYAQEQARSTDEKRLIEEQIAKEELMLTEDREARKSAAIGDMLGSIARGIKKGAGTGFGGEIISGLEEGAAASTTISKEDRKALKDAEKILDKNKKDAAKEWDKGNKDKALQLLNIANTNYALKLEELKVGFNKLNARTEAIENLSRLIGIVKPSEFDAIANNYIAQGLFPGGRAEINSVMTIGSELAGANNEVVTSPKIKEDNKIKLEPLPEIEMFKYSK